MRSVIQQSVILPASAEQLFEMYLDPQAHAAFTGHPVTIGPQPGDAFQAFGGQLSGTMLAVVRPKLIVQSWRSVIFKPDDADSTLIIMFSPETNDTVGRPQGRIDLVHLDVPEHDFQGVTEGWPKFYWTPWREYLQREK
jgi:activator of HSP90 ATPase